MKRYFKFLIIATSILTAVIVDPPSGNIPGQTGTIIPAPGQPPIIVVFPGGGK
ncbi:MAG: hypothetical protein IKQ46_01765 [Bacteroidales bacterium]|nr:hypothetical protein [Bacteroidales bacterium]MBR6297917.1 hypothetical protein [Candidatus Gastranaerophilales bacterium]